MMKLSIQWSVIIHVSVHIFHDFSTPKAVFHDIPDLEDLDFKFHYSRLFQDLYEPCFPLSMHFKSSLAPNLGRLLLYH